MKKQMSSIKIFLIILITVQSPLNAMMSNQNVTSWKYLTNKQLIIGALGVVTIASVVWWRPTVMSSLRSRFSPTPKPSASSSDSSAAVSQGDSPCGAATSSVDATTLITMRPPPPSPADSHPATVTSITFDATYHCNNFKHISDITNGNDRIFVKDPNYQDYIKLETYYHQGQYQADMTRLCQEAEKYFATKMPGPHDTIIVDKDGVLLYDSNWKMANKGEPGAIKPIVEFLQRRKKQGYKLVLLTGAIIPDNYGFVIKGELLNGNCLALFDQIICGYKGDMGEFYQSSIDKMLLVHHKETPGDFKLKVRKWLATKYKIVAGLGDQLPDFHGGYSGSCHILFPNLLTRLHNNY